MSEGMREMVRQIAAGLVRRGDEVLLVRQQGPHETRSAWALPGGVVEPGELLSEALVRELREETGLTVAGIGPLLYVTHHINPGFGLSFDGAPNGPGFCATAAIFEIVRCEGELFAADPDGFILDVGFFPLDEAITRLEGQPYRVMREPIIGYLGGEAPSGTVWCYRRRPDGEDELVARMDGSGGPWKVQVGG